MVRGDHTSCAAINTRLLEIATTSGNRDLALMAHDTVGQTLYYQGAFEEALGHFSGARDLYNAEAHRELAVGYAEEDPGVAVLGYGGVTLWLLGRRSEGREWLEEAVALAESLPFLITRGLVTSLVVHLAYFRRDVVAARSAVSALLPLLEPSGPGYYLSATQTHEGWVQALDGDAEAGIDLMRTGAAGFERIGALVEQPFNALLLADGLLHAQRPAEAVTLLDETLATIRRRAERCLEAELLRVRGEALAAQGAPADQVERDIEAAIVIATERSAASLRLHAATSLTRFRVERELAADPAMLTDALAAVTDDLDQPDVVEARAVLSQLPAPNRSPDRR
jgi:tetratricopeptide (TPR) repeat protein